MWELEAHALRMENKSCQDFLIAHQAVLEQALQTLKDDLQSSYSLLLGQSFSTCPPLTLAPASQAGGQPPSLIPLKSEPTLSLPPKRWHSSTEAQVDTSIDEDFPTTSQEESSNPKRRKTSDWLTSMKSEHVDAFSWDSDSIKEARAHYFATHSWNWAQGNVMDLSDIFKELVQKAGLLDESIFEIQWSWKGPEHLQQANYIFQSQSKGLRFLRVVSAKESPKEMGLKGIHDPEGPSISQDSRTAHGVGNQGRMRGLL